MCVGGAVVVAVNKQKGSVLVMMLDMLRQALLSAAVAVAVASAACLK